MQETIKTKNGYREQVIENNQVTIMGEIVSEFSFSHEILYGKYSGGKIVGIHGYHTGNDFRETA